MEKLGLGYEVLRSLHPAGVIGWEEEGAAPTS